MIETAFERWARESADQPGSAPPPGSADRLALMTLQGSWWCDQHDDWRRVEDMEPTHRRRLLDQLRKRADAWHAQWLDQGGDLLRAIDWHDASSWVEGLPLVRALASFDDRISAPIS